MSEPRVVRAPRGSELSCKGWPQEATLRLLMNNLDPDVAERPEDLVVYGGTGRAARSWDAFDRIVEVLRRLEDDETLLIQSGKPVAVFRTHRWAPRVLLANALVVPEWATHEEFRKLEEAGLTMFGQMTAGSWNYIGSQGILQSTYETFAAVAEQEFNGSLAGTLTVTAGLGGMGGAQPLAVTLNEGVVLCFEADQKRLDRRLKLGYLDQQADNLDDAIAAVLGAKDARRPLSVGLRANAGEALREIIRREVPVDIATDQTPAHDPLLYIPAGLSAEEAAEERKKWPREYVARSRADIARHVESLLELMDRGAVVFEYGNGIRAEAQRAGLEKAFAYPGFISAYIRPYFCEAKGHCRWIALSGNPQDIHTIDRALVEAMPDNRSLTRWLSLAADKVPFQGLPARTAMIGYGEREFVGLLINDLVAQGKVDGPLAISREHLDAGSVASPYRETEAMRDGSDAIADWPILNGLLCTASGATNVAVHHGGGVGIGRSIHSGLMVLADGTPEARERIMRVLTNDPGSGVVRYADAGYPEAIRFGQASGIDMPSVPAIVAPRSGQATS